MLMLILILVFGLAVCSLVGVTSSPPDGIPIFLWKAACSFVVVGVNIYFSTHAKYFSDKRLQKEADLERENSLSDLQKDIIILSAKSGHITYSEGYIRKGKDTESVWEISGLNKQIESKDCGVSRAHAAAQLSQLVALDYLKQDKEDSSLKSFFSTKRSEKFSKSK